MNKALLFAAFFIFNFSFLISKSFAQDKKPDTVSVGIYVNSIHDIDFRQKEYTANLWLWLKYKNKEFDFEKTLEIPQAKTFVKLYPTTNIKDDSVYMLMKLQCVMKDSWKIGKFPFDRQRLRLAIENSQFDSRYLIFAADTLGNHYGRYTINAWDIDSFNISVGKKIYETSFGDASLDKPRAEYSTFRVVIVIERIGPWELFVKLFIGMYISFLISYVCFYIHADSIDSRFGVSVGSLFAVIGNKYIIDSSLPESASLTLVDTLHGLTLLFILAVITASAYSLNLYKKNKAQQANKFDMIVAQILLVVYVILNIWFIWQATID